MRNSVFTKLAITSYVDLRLKYWTTKHTVQQTKTDHIYYRKQWHFRTDQQITLLHWSRPTQII